MVKYDDFEMPKTWKGKMEALVNGAVDYDDWHEVAMECAAVADKAVIATKAEREAAAKARGKMDFSPLWSDVMPQLLDWLLGSQPRANRKQKKLFAQQAAQIVHCGEVADAWEAGEVPVAV